MNLRNIASPLTIASFIVAAITGLCMFFGYRGGLVNPIHESFTLVFVFACVLHIVANWQAVLNHLKRRLGIILTVFFVIVTVVALVPSGAGAGDGNPVRKTVGLLMNADLSAVAALAKTTEQDLQERLKQNGFTAADPGATVSQIAESSQRNPMEVLSVLLADAPTTAP